MEELEGSSRASHRTAESDFAQATGSCTRPAHRAEGGRTFFKKVLARDGAAPTLTNW